jgi:hypothetical protein
LLVRVFVATSCLLIAYSVFLFYFPAGRSVQAQNQWDENRIKAEKFIYDTTAYDRVIVGSSLAARLPDGVLPNTYNLAFSSRAAVDGLMLVLKREKLPRILLIETNVLLLGSNEAFVSSLIDPVSFYPKKYVPALRTDCQPLASIGAKARPFVRKLLTILKKGSGTAGATYDSSKFSKLLKATIDSYALVPSNSEAAIKFDEVRVLVNRLSSQGVKIVFLEIPVHCAIVRSPRAKLTREYAERYFNTQQYVTVPEQSCEKYLTTDGIHLRDVGALEYSQWLKDYLIQEGL